MANPLQQAQANAFNAIKVYLGKSPYDAAYDANNDGKVDLSDALSFQKTYKGLVNDKVQETNAILKPGEANRNFFQVTPEDIEADLDLTPQQLANNKVVSYWSSQSEPYSRVMNAINNDPSKIKFGKDEDGNTTISTGEHPGWDTLTLHPTEQPNVYSFSTYNQVAKGNISGVLVANPETGFVAPVLNAPTQFAYTPGSPGGVIRNIVSGITSGVNSLGPLGTVALAFATQGLSAELGAALGLEGAAATLAGNTLLQTTLNGGDVGKALTNSLITYAGASAGGLAGQFAQGGELGEFLAKNPQYAATIANTATRAALTGQSLEDAVKAATVSVGTDAALSKIDGFNNLDNQTKNVIRNSVAAQLQGKDVNLPGLLTNAAINGVTSYALNQNEDFQKLDPTVKSLLVTELSAGLQNKPLDQAAINWAMNQGAQSINKAINQTNAAIKSDQATIDSVLDSKSTGVNKAEVDAGTQQIVDAITNAQNQTATDTDTKVAGPGGVTGGETATPDPLGLTNEQKAAIASYLSNAAGSNSGITKDENGVYEVDDPSVGRTLRFSSDGTYLGQTILVTLQEGQTKPVVSDFLNALSGKLPANEKAEGVGADNKYTYTQGAGGQDTGAAGTGAGVGAGEGAGNQGAGSGATDTSGAGAGSVGTDAGVSKPDWLNLATGESIKGSVYPGEDGQQRIDVIRSHPTDSSKNIYYTAVYDPVDGSVSYETAHVDPNGVGGSTTISSATKPTFALEEDLGRSGTTSKQPTADEIAQAIGFPDAATYNLYGGKIDEYRADLIAAKNHQDIMDTFHAVLGRDPTPEEYVKFAGQNAIDVTKAIEPGLSGTKTTDAASGYSSVSDAQSGTQTAYSGYSSISGAESGAASGAESGSQSGTETGYSGYSSVSGAQSGAQSGTDAESGRSGYSSVSGAQSGTDSESGYSGYSNVSGAQSGTDAQSGSSGYSSVSGAQSGTDAESGSSGYSSVSGAQSGTGAESGYSGYSSVSGAQSGTEPGASGYSGYSGLSGLDGGSGYSGYSGESGYSGDSGYSGESGYSGRSGYSGTSGDSGYSGRSGDSGYSGRSGDSGYSGTSGNSGYSGTSGDSGYSGWSGGSGYSGTSGNSGYSGTSGNSGYSGLTGRAGLDATSTAFGAQFGSAGTGAVAGPTASELKPQFLTSKETPYRFTSPLAAVLALSRGMDTGENQAPLGGNPMQTPHYSYGNVSSIDEILGLPDYFSALGGGSGSEMPQEAEVATGGLMSSPLMAATGGTTGTRYGKYAAGGLPGNVVHHSGKARVDFRHGDAVTGAGDGQSDDIPAMLADGEFVFPADVVAAIGNGSTKAGSDKLYDMMHGIRAHVRSAKPKDLPPEIKSPLDFLGKKHRKA